MGRLQRPVSTELVDAVCASDADVIAFYPYLYHPTVAAIGKVRAPAVLHPAAHDEPALYLPVFRGTFGDADAFCYHTAAERGSGRADVPGRRAPPDRARPRRGGVRGHRPARRRAGGPRRPALPRERGPGRRAQGLEMLASYFATLQGAPPGPLALALVGPVSDELPPHPDIVVTGPVDEADKWDIVPRRPGGGLTLGARVVLAGGGRGLGGSGARPGQRCLRADPRARRALGWRTVVHVLPRIRGRAATGWCRTPICAPRSAARGRDYVDRHFQWPVLIARYDRFLTTVVERGRGTPGLF